MKKLVFLGILVGLCSCTNINQDFSSVLKKIDLEQKESIPSLNQENIILTKDTVQDILKDVSFRLRSGQIRNYESDYSGRYEVYVGDYVSLPLELNENNYNVIKYPNDVNYNIKIDGNKLLFRSLYAGNYEILIYSDTQMTRKIKISNILKYNFTENDIYNLIVSCYNEMDLKGLNDSISLSRIAFPDSSRNKEISFLLIDLAVKDGNTKIIKDEMQYLQKHVVLNDFDKKQLITALNMIEGKDYSIPDDLLKADVQSREINTEIAKLILKKQNMNTNEALFLESIYNAADNKREIAESLSSWYTRNGNVIKGQEYKDKLNSLAFDNDFSYGGEKSEAQILEEKNYEQYKQLLENGEDNYINENYIESIMDFEKALSMDKNYGEEKKIYFNVGKAYSMIGKYQQAIDNLKKSLKLEKNDEKKAEIYYNIGTLYKKLGDVNQATNYFTYVIQNFKDSSWSVKSKMNILE